MSHVFKDEAGNVLTIRIKKADVFPTIKFLEKLTGLELVDEVIGTAGKSTTSSDLDIALDANLVHKDEFAEKLSKYVKQLGHKPNHWVKVYDDIVHFKTPIKGEISNGFVQTDFMFGEPNWMKFAMTGEPEDTGYTGAHRNELLASIANARGMEWDYHNGLLDATTHEVITRDPNEIAKKLLGLMTGPKDLESVDSILNVVKRMPDYETLVHQARETLEREGVHLPEVGKIESSQIGTTAWFRRMMESLK